MVQEIVKLPETASISIGWRDLVIDNHKVTSEEGMFYWAVAVVAGYDWDVAVSRMIRQKISYEAFIECCAAELENDINTLANMAWWHTDMKNRIECNAFVSSPGGKNIAMEIVEKIRGCDNWNEFRVLFQEESDFKDELRLRFNEEYGAWSKKS